MLLFLVILSSIVSADTFDLAGCDGSVTVGINAVQPIRVYSNTCTTRNERILDCTCKDGKLSLYSKDYDKEHDLVFEYGEMRKRIDNHIFQEAYTNEFLNIVLFFIISVFVVFIMIPVIIIYNAVKNS